MPNFLNHLPQYLAYFRYSPELNAPTLSMMSKLEKITKKERLTLSQLARYDDILTDTLVDHVCAP